MDQQLGVLIKQEWIVADQLGLDFDVQCVRDLQTL